MRSNFFTSRLLMALLSYVRLVPMSAFNALKIHSALKGSIRKYQNTYVFHFKVKMAMALLS